MRYGLLGNLEVRRDDGTLADLGGIQPRRVLALLLAASGRVVPVDAVIDELWGDDVPASASGTLQSYISRLRRAIDPERTGSGQVLAWEPPGYRLEVPADEVDFRRFERLAREGRELLDDGRPAEALDRLTEADGLWRGAALVEFADQDFARRASPPGWRRDAWPPPRTASPPSWSWGCTRRWSASCASSSTATTSARACGPTSPRPLPIGPSGRGAAGAR